MEGGRCASTYALCVLGNLVHSGNLVYRFFLVFDILEVHTSLGSTTEAPDSDQMFKLADLLEGVSVDCTDLSRTELQSN